MKVIPKLQQGNTIESDNTKVVRPEIHEPIKAKPRQYSIVDLGGEPSNDTRSAAERNRDYWHPIKGAKARFKASMSNETNPLVGIERTILPSAAGAALVTTPADYTGSSILGGGNLEGRNLLAKYIFDENPVVKRMFFNKATSNIKPISRNEARRGFSHGDRYEQLYPADYAKRWNDSPNTANQVRLIKQAALMDKVGRPFILQQSNPIWIEGKSVRNPELVTMAHGGRFDFKKSPILKKQEELSGKRDMRKKFIKSSRPTYKKRIKKAQQGMRFVSYNPVSNPTIDYTDITNPINPFSEYNYNTTYDKPEALVVPVRDTNEPDVVANNPTAEPVINKPVASKSVTDKPVTANSTWKSPYTNRKQWSTELINAYKKAGITNDNAIRMLLAQDALESSWGKSAQGKYNFGNLTTGSSWKGDYVTGNDKNAKGEAIKQKFRSYNSMDEYAADKIQFLKRLYDFDENDDINKFVAKLTGSNKGKRRYAEASNYAKVLTGVYNGIPKGEGGLVVNRRDAIKDYRPNIPNRIRRATPAERIQSMINIYGQSEQPIVTSDTKSPWQQAQVAASKGAPKAGVWFQGKLGTPRDATNTSIANKVEKAANARDLFAKRPVRVEGDLELNKPLVTVGDVPNRAQIQKAADTMGGDGVIFNNVYDNGYGHNQVIFSYRTDLKNGRVFKKGAKPLEKSQFIDTGTSMNGDLDINKNIQNFVEYLLNPET